MSLWLMWVQLCHVRTSKIDKSGGPTAAGLGSWQSVSRPAPSCWGSEHLDYESSFPCDLEEKMKHGQLESISFFIFLVHKSQSMGPTFSFINCLFTETESLSLSTGFSLTAEPGNCPCHVQAPHRGGFSCCGTLALGTGLVSWGMWAPRTAHRP